MASRQLTNLTVMTLNRRLLLGIAPVLLILLAVGIYAILLFSHLGGAIDVILRENYVSVVAVAKHEGGLRADGFRPAARVGRRGGKGQANSSSNTSPSSRNTPTSRRTTSRCPARAISRTRSSSFTRSISTRPPNSSRCRPEPGPQSPLFRSTSPRVDRPQRHRRAASWKSTRTTCSRPITKRGARAVTPRAI